VNTIAVTKDWSAVFGALQYHAQKQGSNLTGIEVQAPHVHGIEHGRGKFATVHVGDIKDRDRSEIRAEALRRGLDVH
jgi:hypothetical protein